MWVVGAMYRIARKGQVLPNLYRFEGEQAQHCQLHGEYIGQQWLFRKRRNSETKPWGGLHEFSALDEDLQIERVD